MDLRRQPRSPEVRAKISATLKAKGFKPVSPGRPRPRTRPLPGTPERRLFNKIAELLGTATAYAELRRGV